MSALENKLIEMKYRLIGDKPPGRNIKPSRAVLIMLIMLAIALPVAMFLIPPIFVLLGLLCLIALGVAVYNPYLSFLTVFVAEPILRHWIFIPLGAGIPDLTSIRGFGFFFGCLVAFKSYIMNKPFKKFGDIEKLILIFMFVSLASLVRSKTFTMDTQFLLDNYLIPMMFYFLAREMVSKKEHLLMALLVAIASGMMLAAIGAVQKATHGAIIPGTQPGFTPTHPTRMTGPFYNAAEFGGIMGMYAVIIASYIGHFKGIKNFILIAVCGILVGCVGMTMSRGPLVGLLVGSIMISAYNKEFRKYFIGAIVVGIIGGLIALPIILNNEEFTSRFGEVGPIYNRIISQATGLNMFFHKPIFGFGFGRYTYALNSLEYLTSVFGISVHYGSQVGVPHCEFIHILVLLGLTGFIPYVLIFKKAASVRKYAPNVTEPLEKAFLIGAGAAAIVNFFNALFVDIVFFSFNNLLFFTIIGIAKGFIYDHANARK